MKRKGTYLFLLLFTFILVGCTNKGCLHNFGELEVLEQATCAKEGVLGKTCKLCGYVLKQSIEKTEHVYSTEYAKTGEGHYHSCLHCNTEFPVEEHVNGIPNEHGKVNCAICNYLLVEGDTTYYQNLMSGMHTFEFDIVNTSIYTKEERINSDSVEIIIKDAKGYVDLSDIKDIHIYINGEFEERKYLNDVLKSTTTINGEILIDNTKDLYLVGTAKSPNTVEGNLDGKYYGKMNISEVVEENLSMITIAGSLSDEFGLITKIEELYNSILKAHGLTTGDIIDTLYSNLFVKEETNDGVELRLDTEYIIETIKNLMNLSGKEIYESAFGEGSYEKLKEDAVKIVNTKISRILFVLKTKHGIDVEKVIDILDAIAKEVTSDPTSTHVDMFEVDLRKKLNDQELLDKTICDLLIEAMEDEYDTDFTPKQIEEDLIDIFDQFGDVCLSDISNDFEEIEEVLDGLKEAINVLIETNKDDLVEKVTLNVKLDTKFDSTSLINANVNIELRRASNEPTTNVSKEVSDKFASVDFENVKVNGTDKVSCVYEDGVLSKITFKYTEENITIYGGGELYNDVYKHVKDHSVVVELDKLESYSIEQRCKNTLLVTFVPLNYFKDAQERTNAHGIQLIETGEIQYTQSTSYFETEAVYEFVFAYDLDTKEITFIDPFTVGKHDFTIVQTVQGNQLTCGDVIKRHYTCTKCGLKVVENEVIEHIDDNLKADVSFVNGVDCAEGTKTTYSCERCHKVISEKISYSHKQEQVYYGEYTHKECYDKHGIYLYSCPCHKRVDWDAYGMYLDYTSDEVILLCDYCNIEVKIIRNDVKGYENVTIMWILYDEVVQSFEYKK